MYFRITAVLLLVSVTFAAQFPFPQNKTYRYGISASSIDSAAIQSIYREWKHNFYTQKDSVARIKWDDPYESVSEGIAYGMLIMVYMDNSTNDTKAGFDKLWKYYTEFSDSNGLMNWYISGFGGVSSGGNGAATDADLDAALALCMAYRQWDDSTYLAGARSLIRSIRRFEVDSSHHLKPGDEWNTAKNVSYLSFAAMRLFKLVDRNDQYTSDVKAFWQEVIDSSYALAFRAQNQQTGLVPDWCGTGGQPKDPENNAREYDKFNYDAVRTPWRMAWTYYWFGDSLAREFNSKIAEWVGQFGSPGEVSNTSLPLDGTGAGNAFCMHPFYAAWTLCGTVDSSYLWWVDTGVTDWMVDTDFMADRVSGILDDYYPATLLVLNTLLISGNMPDLTEGYSFDGPNGIKTSHINRVSGLSAYYTINNKRLKIRSSEQSPVNSVKIFDLKGRECASQNFTSKTGPKTVSLNTFNLSDNIYFVKINGNWKSHTIKVPLFR